MNADENDDIIEVLRSEFHMQAVYGFILGFVTALAICYCIGVYYS